MLALPFCNTVEKGERPKEKGYPHKPTTWGDHVKKRRMDLKLFQRHVAEQIGVDIATIHNWERNLHPPAQNLVPKIIEFLGYSPFPQPVDLSKG